MSDLKSIIPDGSMVASFSSNLDFESFVSRSELLKLVEKHNGSLQASLFLFNSTEDFINFQIEFYQMLREHSI